MKKVKDGAYSMYVPIRSSSYHHTAYMVIVKKGMPVYFPRENAEDAFGHSLDPVDAPRREK